ncbi:uncharacterized protein LOC114767274 [Denticeps clupeoides]|uniref:Uncharacterized protein n=1 Tax=Denticeps clupeoides TaxID=299321 RepID=A0AAY4CZS7_9TELE|nr:uncharacterized protein LOC114767274 [Denticeps clupeoides]
MISRVSISGGVTAHKISKSITYYHNHSVQVPGRASVPENRKPLLLLLPWLGSRPKATAKYCDIYFRAGFDVLSVDSDVLKFLWPRWGLQYGAHVLELLQSERFSQRPLLVHALSIGGYTFAQLLVHVAKDVQRYQGLLQRIHGHVYDSLVMGSLDRMAIGVAKNTVPRFAGLVKSASLLYFRVFKRQTVDYFNMGVDAFWESPVTAPALFFYSQNDDLCDWEKLEELIGRWSDRGVSVQSRKWAESVHAAHLHVHSEEYLSTLNGFLQTLDMVPLRAKM